MPRTKARTSSVRQRWRWTLALLCVLLLLVGGSFTRVDAQGKPQSCGPPVTIAPFIANGYMMAWNHRVNRIAYAAPDKQGIYRLHLVDPDGTHDELLGEGNPDLPAGHDGSPGWSPDGAWIAFSAEKPHHPGSHVDAIPGFGGYSDIWVISSDGRRLFRLTDEPIDNSHGVIIPRFSPDGRHLVWSARVASPNFFSAKRAMGYWVLRVADFSVDRDGVPSVHNLRDYRAQGDAFYEDGGFSPDGTKLLFTSNYLTGKWWQNQIYRIDLETSKVEALTNSNYNEHPSYTPDGRIIWMTGQDNKPLPGWLSPGTDWWLMDADGTHKERLTDMNARGQPGFTGHSVWAGTVTWSADGTRFIGDVQTNLLTQQGKAVWVTLTCPAPGDSH